jgi:hypothetical protein
MQIIITVYNYDYDYIYNKSFLVECVKEGNGAATAASCVKRITYKNI